MSINPSPVVDDKGLIYLPYLTAWMPVSRQASLLFPLLAPLCRLCRMNSELLHVLFHACPSHTCQLSWNFSDSPGNQYCALDALHIVPEIYAQSKSCTLTYTNANTNYRRKTHPNVLHNNNIGNRNIIIEIDNLSCKNTSESCKTMQTVPQICIDRLASMPS